MRSEINKSVLLLLCLLFLAIPPATSHAMTYTFSSFDGSGTQNDLKDLDHYYYYTWGINWTLPEGEIITGASIRIKNLTDWTREEDILKMYLLDNPKINDVDNKVDIWSISDNQSQSSANELTSKLGVKFSDILYLTNYQDSDDQYTTTNFRYDLIDDPNDPNVRQLETLRNFLETPNTYTYWKNGVRYTYNSNFGLGFDPDCHYYNDGIEFIIETETRVPPQEVVPEPSTMLLMLAGAAAIGFYRRFRRS